MNQIGYKLVGGFIQIFQAAGLTVQQLHLKTIGTTKTRYRRRCEIDDLRIAEAGRFLVELCNDIVYGSSIGIAVIPVFENDESHEIGTTGAREKVSSGDHGSGSYSLNGLHLLVELGGRRKRTIK